MVRLRKLVPFGSGRHDRIFMGKVCVRICNEQTICSNIVSLFSIMQIECRKLQYDWERSAKFFNDRNQHGTKWRNDSKILTGGISSELGLSYGSEQYRVFDVLRYSKTLL
ncbi:hypothetical protein TNCV_4371491 [Trichonephila clavipes]|nr:hypothetical protein TNCV_4371491 [Trichonephila clavipes]